MATLGNDTVGNGVAMAASLAANVILPGSGAVVGQVVKAGAAIISGLANIFKKKKKEGKTDAQAAAEAAQEISPEEAAELKRIALEVEQYEQYLSEFTQEDKNLSTLFKSAKMGKYPEVQGTDRFTQATYFVEQGFISPKNLVALAHFVPQYTGDTTSSNPHDTANFGGFTVGKPSSTKVGNVSGSSSGQQGETVAFEVKAKEVVVEAAEFKEEPTTTPFLIGAIVSVAAAIYIHLELEPSENKRARSSYSRSKNAAKARAAKARKRTPTRSTTRRRRVTKAS